MSFSKTTLQYARESGNKEIINAIMDTQAKLAGSGLAAAPPAGGGGGGGGSGSVSVDSKENITKFVEFKDGLLKTLKMRKLGLSEEKLTAAKYQ